MALHDEFKKVSERMIVALDNMTVDALYEQSFDDFKRDAKLFQSLVQKAGIYTPIAFGMPGFQRHTLFVEFEKLNKLMEASSNLNPEIARTISDISTVFDVMGPLR